MTIEELYRRYRGHIFHCCRKYIKDSADIEDVVQTVFLKAWKALGKFESRSEHFTWLYRIAVNECLNHLKKRKKESVSFDEVIWSSDEIAVFSTEERRLLWEFMIKSIDKKERVIIFLYSVEGLSISEIADVVEVSRQALHKKLKAIMSKLKRKFGE
jgi:RNA polymerase sigma-70 factor (ECF subfamily)